jgi:hypothetical protein
VLSAAPGAVRAGHLPMDPNVRVSRRFSNPSRPDSRCLRLGLPIRIADRRVRMSYLPFWDHAGDRAGRPQEQHRVCDFLFPSALRDRKRRNPSIRYYSTYPQNLTRRFQHFSIFWLLAGMRLDERPYPLRRVQERGRKASRVSSEDKNYSDEAELGNLGRVNYSRPSRKPRSLRSPKGWRSGYGAQGRILHGNLLSWASPLGRSPAAGT